MTNVFRRKFLKSAIAGSALPISSTVSAAQRPRRRKRRRKSPSGATVRNFHVVGRPESNNDTVSVSTGSSTVRVDGTIGSLKDCVSISDTTVTYENGELRFTVEYVSGKCSRRGRRRRHDQKYPRNYRAKIDVPSEPDAVVVQHVDSTGTEPAWQFRTDESVEYDVEFESLDTTNDWEDRAEVSFHQDRIEIDGVVSNGACRFASLTGVEYTDGELTVAVDAVKRPDSGDVCITAARGIEYRATVHFSEQPAQFTVEHNDDWQVSPERVSTA